ncbi:acyltransferase family protein [Peribacillus simplex]|uniref:acyltransferase family protein n=1 Tax=Peribacillus simplex TaxID=1478 RepID=UPI003390A71B
MFFIISGFVIFMTITNTKNVSEFAKKRYIRLYPAYISSVVITFLMVTLYGLEGRGVSSSKHYSILQCFKGLYVLLIM